MNRKATSYTVGQVPELAGVTVPALHHYDQIGLLSPSTQDPHFTATHEDMAEGLATYLPDAIRANAARTKAD